MAAVRRLYAHVRSWQHLEGDATTDDGDLDLDLDLELVSDEDALADRLRTRLRSLFTRRSPTTTRRRGEGRAADESRGAPLWPRRVTPSSAVVTGRRGATRRSFASSHGAPAATRRLRPD